MCVSMSSNLRNSDVTNDPCLATDLALEAKQMKNLQHRAEFVFIRSVLPRKGIDGERSHSSSFLVQTFKLISKVQNPK